MNPEATIGLGAAIAAVVAVVKQAFPQLPSRAIPLLVLGLAAALVVLGAAAGHGSLDPYELSMRIIGQVATALGVREGVVTAYPQASTLPSLMRTGSDSPA